MEAGHARTASVVGGQQADRQRLSKTTARFAYATVSRMYPRSDLFMRTARAPAKLNLFLEILGRRGDGFHELETLIVPIRLGDWLTLVPTPPTEDGRPGEILLDVRNCLAIRPPSRPCVVPSGAANLVVRALELLRERSGCRYGARVELVKQIPAEAGLGGGSSDAAAALRLANRAWQLDWPKEQLTELAAELGSDVPFFLAGCAAVCRGRGERIEPLPPMSPLHFVVVKPSDDLRTADVYRAYNDRNDAAPNKKSLRLDQIVPTLHCGRWIGLQQWMHNRLQAAASTLSPWIEQLQWIFEQFDCLGHQLSGSGSAYFGVCRHALHARRLATLLRQRQLGLVYATRSCP